MTRRIPEYRDVLNYYPTPSTGQLVSAGWLRQLAFNYDQMFAAHSIKGGAGNNLGAFEFTPTFSGVTTTGTVNDNAHYIPIGQMVYCQVHCLVSTLDASSNGFTLPIPAADTYFSMPIGYGVYHDASAVRSYPLVPILDRDTGAVVLHTVEPDTGPLVEGAPVAAGGGDVIGVFMKYRRPTPGVGRLNDLDYAPDEQIIT